MSSPFPSPYEPPQYAAPHDGTPGGSRPQVVIWYKVYCVFMTLLYALFAGLGAVFMCLPPELFGSDPDMSTEQAFGMGLMFLLMGTPFALLFLVAAFLPANKVGWIGGVVAIGLGLTSACLWPMTIPLLIFWLKDATRSYYNMK